MKRTIFFATTLALATSLTSSVVAQQGGQRATRPSPQEAARPAATQQAPAIDRRKVPLAERPNLSLQDVNTLIGVDKRVIVMMAALNVAGYDYESGNRPLSGLRQQMREDLKNTPPAVARKLRDHFLAHSKGSKDAAAAAPYLSLALCLNEPPAFTIDVPTDRLPDDVREITDFALILEEFYQTTGFSKLLPKYVDAYMKVAATYPQAAGLALGNILVYLHTDPILELPPLFIPRRTPPAKPEKKADKKSDKKNKKDDKKSEETKTDVAAVAASVNQKLSASLGQPLSLSEPAVPDEMPTTAPELPGAKPKPEEPTTEEEPKKLANPIDQVEPVESTEADEPSELKVNEYDDSETNNAVDDIAAHESDLVLEVEDRQRQRKAEQVEPAKKSGGWGWVIIVVLVIAAAIGGLDYAGFGLDSLRL